MNIVIILSGGTGTRLGGDIPKQYIEIDGKPVIGYCLDTFFAILRLKPSRSWRTMHGGNIF